MYTSMNTNPAANTSILMATIYDPKHAEELRAYTLRLLNLLETCGCVDPSKMNGFNEQFLSKDGDVNFDIDSGVDNSKKKELEYLVWNGNKYYYCYADHSLYTFSNQPTRIGHFDYDSMTVVVV